MLVSASAAGCSDDDGDSDGDAGASGHDHGGAAGAGDSASGGTAGAPDLAAGAGGVPQGTAGAAQGAAGNAGEGGSGTGPVEFDAITQLEDRTLTQVNDLRGLTFSKSGKIYASGYADPGGTDRQLAILRLNANGTLDESFSGDGIVLLNLAIANKPQGHSGNEESLSIVELENGDIIVQANVADGQGGALIDDAAKPEGEDAAADDVARLDGTNVVLLRFDDEGEPVDSFGEDGAARIDFGWKPADDASWPAPTYDSSKAEASRWSGPGFPTDTSWGIGIDKSGGTEKIVVFGGGPAKKVSAGTQRVDNDRYVVRVLATTGEPDPAFNGGQPVTFFSPGTLNDNDRRGLVEADGSIVSVGYVNLGEGYGNHVLLARFDATGKPDKTFGTSGAPVGALLSNAFLVDGGFAEAYAAVKQKNGRYVTTGYGQATALNRASSYDWTTSQNLDFVSFGFEPGGVDATYGVEGTLAIQSELLVLEGEGRADRGRDLVILPDQRLVHAGRFGLKPAIFVTTPDGEPAADVGTDGRFEYSTNTNHFYRVALSSDGKRIAASTANHEGGARVVILGVGE
jgi:uncharacterized delta-60 repeat protein